MARQRWRDKLRPASFRGVRFLVDRVDYESGRRGPDHEFPDRELPYAEDTGKKQGKWDFDGYVVGPDYFAARNRLQKALEKKGPGDLIHPYYGRLRVMCRSVRITETAGEGGFVRFQLKFVEAGSLSFPKVNSDRAFLVGLASSLLGESAGAALQDVFNTADQINFVAESATEKLLEVAERMESISAGITSSADGLAEFAFALRNLKDSAVSLALSPIALVNNLADIFGLLFAAGSPDESFIGFRKLFTFGADDPTIPETTATRVQEAANLRAMNELVQTLAVVHASNAAVDVEHKSVEDATAARDALADQLDSLMEQTSSDDVYSNLQGLRAQIVEAIPGSDADLAQVAELTLPVDMPSLSLSYELYGNVDQEQDIIDRNKIRHPGFIQGGQPLEVLDRG